MANRYTGMGAPTAIQYQNVMGRINRYLGGGGGSPMNYPVQQPQANYQLMQNTPPNYQAMNQQRFYGYPGAGYGYQMQRGYSPMGYGGYGYMPMMYGGYPGMPVRAY